jgi:hypothetical protein
MNAQEIRSALLSEFNHYDDLLKRLGLSPPIYAPQDLAVAWRALIEGNEFDEMDFDRIMMHLQEENAWHIPTKVISALSGGGPFIDVEFAIHHLEAFIIHAGLSGD